MAYLNSCPEWNMSLKRTKQIKHSKAATSLGSWWLESIKDTALSESLKPQSLPYTIRKPFHLQILWMNSQFQLHWLCFPVHYGLCGDGVENCLEYGDKLSSVKNNEHQKSSADNNLAALWASKCCFLCRFVKKNLEMYSSGFKTVPYKIVCFVASIVMITVLIHWRNFTFFLGCALYIWISDVVCWVFFCGKEMNSA